MEAYQQRVVDEKTELDAKLKKLCAFQTTAAWNTVSAAEKDRLIKQTSIMEAYSNILEERISAF